MSAIPGETDTPVFLLLLLLFFLSIRSPERMFLNWKIVLKRTNQHIISIIPIVSWHKSTKTLHSRAENNLLNLLEL